jgi:hypothetical protein
MILVDNVPDLGSGRFGFIASRRVGEFLKGELIYLRRPEDARMDISIGLSLIGLAASQELLASGS